MGTDTMTIAIAHVIAIIVNGTMTDHTDTIKKTTITDQITIRGATTGTVIIPTTTAIIPMATAIIPMATTIEN
jgi:hypothetical protein